MKLKYEFTTREVMGEYALIPMGESAIRLSGMIVTNAVGAFLCEQLGEEIDQATLVQRLMDEFEVDEATAQEDVDAFVKHLQSMELIQ